MTQSKDPYKGIVIENGKAVSAPYLISSAVNEKGGTEWLELKFAPPGRGRAFYMCDLSHELAAGRPLGGN